MRSIRSRVGFAALAVAGVGLCVASSFSGPQAARAQEAPNAPTSYTTSDASLTSTPTYDTTRANTNGSVTNGQDFDHYCKADWKSQSILAGDTSGESTRVPMLVNKQAANPALKGDNGLLYMNQW